MIIFSSVVKNFYQFDRRTSPESLPGTITALLMVLIVPRVETTVLVTSLEGLPAMKIPPKAHVPKIEPVYMQEQLGGRRGLMFGRNDDIISAFHRFEFRALF